MVQYLAYENILFKEIQKILFYFYGLTAACSFKTPYQIFVRAFFLKTQYL
jgi:hypothetical protein